MPRTNKRTMAFKKGDIIIKAEAVCPHGALVVQEWLPSAYILRVLPEGGGGSWA